MHTQYLTPDELKQRWKGRVSLKTLANWRHNGTGPVFTRVGGAVLYPLHEVVRYEQANTVASTADYGKRQAGAAT